MNDHRNGHTHQQLPESLRRALNRKGPADVHENYTQHCSHQNNCYQILFDNRTHNNNSSHSRHLTRNGNLIWCCSLTKLAQKMRSDRTNKIIPHDRPNTYLRVSCPYVCTHTNIYRSSTKPVLIDDLACHTLRRANRTKRHPPRVVIHLQMPPSKQQSTTST